MFMFHWLSVSHMLSLDPITLRGEFNALIGLLQGIGPSTTAEAESPKSEGW